MRHRRRVLITVLAMAMSVASCSGASEQQPDAPSASVPTASPAQDSNPTPADESPEAAPTPEPLPFPDYPDDLSAEDTPENAIRAAEYFIDLMNYAQSTGDTDALEERSWHDCVACENFIEGQAQRYSAGGFLIGNTIQMEEAFAERTASGHAWVVSSRWNVTAGIKKISEEHEAVEVPARIEEMRIGVGLFNGTWLLVEIAFA